MQPKQIEILQYIKRTPGRNDIDICKQYGVSFNNIQKEWAQRLLYETRAHLVDLLNQGYISCDETNYTVNKSFPNLTITPKGEWFIRKSIIAKWSYIIAFTVPVAMAAWISLAQAIKKFF